MSLKKLIKEIAKKPINNIKGKIGEAKVDMALNPLLFGKVEHRQINNLILVDDNGKSHQIDHIEIRQNGIFCIETKNYKGWIFGSEKQDKWTQTLYNGEKHQFLNPLNQNNSHIYHISKALDNKYRINSVIVMAQNNADKVDCDNVINLNELKTYLRNFDNGTFYSIEEMNDIYQKLTESSVKLSNRDHVNNIKETENNLKQGICPRCGGRLVERNGKYGLFMGCVNFPNCKFILKD